MNFARELLPAITYLSILAGYILIFHLIRTCYRLKKWHSPLGDIVFRSPGQSLIKKIDDLTQDIGLNMALFISVPLVLYANYISHLYFYQDVLNIWIVALLGGIGTAVTFNYLIKTLKLLKKRQFIRLEYENTIAVGQELNRLMLEGYHVYHEIPADRLFSSLFKHIKPRMLPDDIINRIVRQLEQRGHDAVPGTRQSDNTKPAMREPG